MKKKGSISVFLAIVFLSVVLLVCAIAEAARVNAIQAKDKSITYMAADSVIAGYAKQVYEDYGVLLVWEKESLEDSLKNYIQANIKMADIEVSGYDFLNSDLTQVSISKKVRATDDGGDAFVEQVSEYLKYAGMTSAINKLLNNSKEVKEDTSDNTVTDDITDKSYEKLADQVEKINENIGEMSNIEEWQKINEEVNGALDRISSKWNSKDKKIMKSVYKKCEKIKKLASNRKSKVDETISKIESYLEKKSDLLKKNNYKKPAKDYMDENLTVLKHIKDKIEEIEAFEIPSAVGNNPQEKSRVEKFFNRSSQLVDHFKDLQVSVVTEKDKKNKSIFDSAKDFLDKGILSLVVEEPSKLSTASVNTSSLPSVTSVSKSKESSALSDKAVMGVYANIMFGNYLSPKKGKCLNYGLEYVVGGKDSDKANLSAVVKRLVAIRHIPNLACLMKDATKQEEIEAIAASIATVTGLPFLEPIAKVILIEAWVMAESVADVRALLAGKKLSLVKTTSNWKTSLTNLGQKNSEGDSSGFKYEVYLGFLLMVSDRDDVVYRNMDLIQMNICKQYNKEFRMNKGLMKFTFKANYDIAPLFTAMPWSIGMLSESNSYNYGVECSNGY